MPSKSMPQKSNHDLEEIYSYVCVGSLVYVLQISWSKITIFVMRQRFKNTKKKLIDIWFNKVVKIIILVDKWLQSLTDFDINIT